MTDAPNTAPAFIQTMGMVGVPADLTNQVCQPDVPGTTPVVIYDTTATYAQGNSALVEHADVQLTGTTVATTVVLYFKSLSETTPKWRKLSQVAIAATTYANTVALLSYKLPLKDLLFPAPLVGSGSTSILQFQGLRINSPDRGLQLGVALTVANTAPIIVYLWGGEY